MSCLTLILSKQSVPPSAGSLLAIIFYTRNCVQQERAVNGELSTQPRRKGAESLHLQVTYPIQDQSDESTVFKSDSGNYKIDSCSIACGEISLPLSSTLAKKQVQIAGNGLYQVEI